MAFSHSHSNNLYLVDAARAILPYFDSILGLVNWYLIFRTESW